tara:strand:+ start:6394 stop:7095 length:702 start_codon:yes stop_codon:yes gene_type:complete
MDSASLTSLTPILDGIDRWVELLPLLPIIVSLELVLSADNAVALASITRTLSNKSQQDKALSIGISISLILRLVLIIFAEALIRFWPLKLLAGIYLLIISFMKLTSKTDSINENNYESSDDSSIFNVIVALSITDLAFSIDSITAAISISDQLLLVITGALIGVLALRFTSGLFVRLLDKYSKLEDAGYIAVAIVGTKLMLTLIFKSLIIPEYIIFILMILLFFWGFSEIKTS